MSNIYGLLTIGSNALLTQQKAVDITGNNIANVNTPGYSRQRLNFVQNTPVQIPGATMSTGVTAESRIQRFYDQFLGRQLNSENGNLGRWEAQQSALEQVESMFDDGSGFGLGSAMTTYWNAWQDVANNPSGYVERASLVSAGEQLAGTFKEVRSNLSGVQENIDTHIDSTVDDINRMAEQIAQLNGKITQVEVNGHNANDYRDERDLLVNKLAKLIDVQSFEDGNGNVVVMVANGKPLVEATSSWDLVSVDNGGVQDVYWQASSGATTDITSDISGGEVKGWIEARDSVIADYINRLDSLAGTMISQVNALHSAGYALDGSQNDFFTGSDASDIAVNNSIVADVNLVAAATSNTALPGDNSNAIAIANLQSSLTMSANSATFDSYYGALVGDVGSDVRAAGLNYDHQTTMVNNLENYRQEVSGVSLDEEMVNLVKFQQAYNAAAKLITTTDRMLDTLMAIAQ